MSLYNEWGQCKLCDEFEPKHAEFCDYQKLALRLDEAVRERQIYKKLHAVSGDQRDQAMEALKASESRLEAADKRAKDYVKAIDSAFNCVSYHNYDEAYKVLRDARLDAVNQSLLGVVERQKNLMPCVECEKMVEPPFAPKPKDRVICGECVERLRERL